MKRSLALIALMLPLATVYPSAARSEPEPITAGSIREANRQYRQEVEEDKNSAPQSPVIPPEMTEQLKAQLPSIMTAAMGINPESREGRNLRRTIDAKGHAALQTDITIAPVKHIFRFSEGKAFPSQAELDVVAGKEKVLTKELVQSSLDKTKAAAMKEAADQNAAVAAAAKELGKPREIPHCSGSNSRTAALPVGTGQSSFMMKDYLFVDNDYPVDPKKAFGSQTFVVRYSTKEGDLVSALYGKLDMPCLPYRMRVTDNIVHYSEGDDALRNYSEDPNGKGFLDVTVKEALARQQESK